MASVSALALAVWPQPHAPSGPAGAARTPPRQAPGLPDPTPDCSLDVDASYGSLGDTLQSLVEQQVQQQLEVLEAERAQLCQRQAQAAQQWAAEKDHLMQELSALQSLHDRQVLRGALAGG